MKAIEISRTGTADNIRNIISQVTNISKGARRALLAVSAVLSMVAVAGVGTDNLVLTATASSAALAIIALDEIQEGGER